MKTVKIPTSKSPFDVMVNGEKYVYPAGTVQDVPDEVAVVIEAHNNQIAKPNVPVEVPFGGVSWNDLKDKPFGDSPTGGDTLYWDGNTEGLASVIAEHALYFKVSDVVPTIEEIGTKYTIQFDNGESIPVGSFMEMGSGVLAHSSYCLVIVPEMGAGVDLGGISFPESGIYFGQEVTDENSVYVASFTIPGYTGFPGVKKIEAKYLPGGVKYVTIGMDEYDNYTASATYDQISEWIRAGKDVKCILGTLVLSLGYSDALADVSTYAQRYHHEFFCLASSTGYQIYIQDNNTVFYSENEWHS